MTPRSVSPFASLLQIEIDHPVGAVEVEIAAVPEWRDHNDLNAFPLVR
jgi:hypothetical protein